MSELRFDPIKRRWVIIAAERAQRPDDFAREPAPPAHANCPVCPGNERYTGHEILAIRDPGSAPDGPGWRVRVVPNKFPVLRVEGALERWGRGLYDVVSGVGAHEVIVETPDHGKTLADLSLEELLDVLKVFRSRLSDLTRDVRLRYLMLFKNHGIDAGARLGHSHSQIIALPEIPDHIARKLRSSHDYFRQKERCLFCDAVRQEVGEGDRLVLDAARFVAFVPFASAFPFEVALYPRFHSHDFTAVADEDLLHLASALRDVLGRLRSTLEDPPYNLALHASPPPHPRPGRPGLWDSLALDWHWHLEIAPRLTRIAGFEWSSGFYINPVAPEEAARYLREVAPR
ncbi:MAG: galactose-1-phosphate uridylyltransferase [Deltaproteobacteria bacterium]|nr:galactose-1-phosphate uridylyltransferase [Deltaproteobacteria bacterium]